jgi:hypothetical protein
VANALPAGWSRDFLPMGKGLAAPLATGMAFSPSRGSSLNIPAFLRTRASAPDTGGRLVSMGAAAMQPGEPPGPTVVFSGVPELASGEAVLFDSSREEDADKLPGTAVLRRIEVRFPDGAPDHKTLDEGLSLLIFVGDLAAPRATVRLVDIVRRRGERPLNISRAAEEVVRIVLVDASGAWKGGAPRIKIALA